MKNTVESTTKQGNEANTLLSAVFLVVDVKMTPKKAKDVLDIINEFTKDEETSMSIATEICDYLGIERRHNRREIIACLPNGR